MSLHVLGYHWTCTTMDIDQYWAHQGCPYASWDTIGHVYRPILGALRTSEEVLMCPGIPLDMYDKEYRPILGVLRTSKEVCVS